MADDSKTHSNDFNEVAVSVLSLPADKQIQLIGKTSRRFLEDQEKYKEKFEILCITFLEYDQLDRRVLKALASVPLCVAAQIKVSESKDSKAMMLLIKHQDNLPNEVQVNFSKGKKDVKEALIEHHKNLCDEAQINFSQDNDCKMRVIISQKSLHARVQVRFSRDADIKILIALASSKSLDDEQAIIALFNRGYPEVNGILTGRLLEFKDVLSDSNFSLLRDNVKKNEANLEIVFEAFDL